MRTPPTELDTGRPESWVDADAPLMARTSYISFGSMDITVMTTCTSLRSPLTKVGRSGRSMRRAARMASVPGRPSRRKKLPGMRPAEYMRSSTSTVSGKKSMPSRGEREAVVVDSSIVSSSRYAVTAPSACRASRPVSRRRVREPKSPLSMVAVASQIPASGSTISTETFLGRLFFLELIACVPRPFITSSARCSLQIIGAEGALRSRSIFHRRA